MSHTGTARDLTQSRDKALQALLGSLTSEDGAKSSPDAAKKLSQKLEELVGGVASADLSRNERGDLVNEEGLPIIDVTEPIPDEESDSKTERLLIPDVPDVTPLTSLPASELERRRIERDKILDILEQEEALELMEDENALYRNREAAQMRKDDGQSEVERLKAAREMQKKMGKALLRNMAEARERKEKLQEDALLNEGLVGEEQRKTLKQKKSVSFAQLPSDGTGEPKDRTVIREKEAQLDWGDVAPARLRSDNRSMPMTKVQMNSLPMKMNVVERIPTASTLPQDPTIDVGDSDDESIPPASDGDDTESDHNGGTVEDVPDSDGEDEDDREDGMGSEDEDFDIDAALHHREVALAYYEKRNAVGNDAAAALTSHTHGEEDDWDQPEVPLEATLSTPRPKPSISRFKANHISAPVSTSLGNSVLPASGFKTVQRAIRTGRLENDQLVGGEEGESASEPEDEAVKEVLELLKRGEVHNIGPTLTPIPAAFSSGTSSTLFASGPSSLPSTANEIASPAPSTAKPKVSKFKLNRSHAPHSPNPIEPIHSAPATPVSHVARSSPKLPATSADGVEFGSIPIPTPLPTTSNILPTQFSMVVDSPSFPPPVRPSSSNFESQPNLSAATGKRLDRPPTVMSSAVFESTGSKGGQSRPNEGKEKKISRFLAERI